jgi:hypothetical protein
MFKPKILRRVTIPVLKMKPNRPYYLKFLAPIHEGPRLEKQKYDNAAQITTVLNFETGEVATLICRTVLVKEIFKAYSNDAYVNKCFEIIFQNHPDPEQKYKLFTISEIAEPSSEDFAPIEATNDDDEDDPQDSHDLVDEPDEGLGDLDLEDEPVELPKAAKKANGKTRTTRARA